MPHTDSSRGTDFCLGSIASSLMLAVGILTMPVARSAAAEPEDAFARWEPTIAKFEAQDRRDPPPKKAVLFVGSSSIRMWNLEKSFPKRKTINRGFGGSVIADSTHFAPRLITKHEPRTIVFYAGDNDISRGLSPEEVAADFRDFVTTIRKSLPKTKILYIAIKPSIARWELWETMRKANSLIQAECEQDESLVFIDIATPMLGENGKPPADLFIKDGLHLSPKGYALWVKELLPHLDRTRDE